MSSSRPTTGCPMESLLRTLTPHGELQGQANDLSPLPERVLSQNAFADGLVPWAALRARQIDQRRLDGALTSAEHEPALAIDVEPGAVAVAFGHETSA